MSSPAPTPPPAFRRTSAAVDTTRYGSPSAARRVSTADSTRYGSPSAARRISTADGSADRSMSPSGLSRRSSNLVSRRAGGSLLRGITGSPDNRTGYQQPTGAPEPFPTDGSLVVDIGTRITKIGVVGELVARQLCRTPPAVADALVNARTAAEAEASAVSAFLELFTLHEFGATSSSEPMVILRNPASNPVFFETLAVAARRVGISTTVFEVSTAVAAAWSVGCVSGIVVDVGYHSSRVVPVLLGQPVTAAIKFTKVGAKEVLSSMKHQICQSPNMKRLDMGRFVEETALEDILYRAGTVAPAAGSSNTTDRERFMAAAFPLYVKTANVGVQPTPCLEQLFTEDRGEDSGFPPLPQLVVASLLACEVSVRAEVAQCLIIRGGLSELGNFEERFSQELSALVYGQQADDTPVAKLRPILKSMDVVDRNTFGGCLAATAGAMIRFRAESNGVSSGLPRTTSTVMRRQLAA